MLIFLYAIVHSWRRGERASANPWGAKTLEWQVPTPVPLENFSVLPVVTSDFYGYGENGHAPVAQPPALVPALVTVPALDADQVDADHDSDHADSPMPEPSEGAAR